ncbi:FHA domain-containing protein [Propionivibrio sp.]|uniref:FHA domain-containing protein n=1 Tax=Propionivibrio sp. TaxID=2212460 RepID=UPI0025DEA256|nr:FHA domain-containing protein [Propionivibrio sp.]MBK7357265.1 FHA domain-containing protein [Propionivibrio sp.]MBK8401338.1 FHA domain-containing protein [Propionivibrio sp.]MBK8745992.1 FHA domain-containing protein [Propionivibrio sp.]MBK8892564.1 FHA domain-containing protein [Propionivibrio sp.]
MNKTRSKYLVHAVILRTGLDTTEFDDAKAGHPLERRLNRLERITASYRGRIDGRTRNTLQMTFDTADAALLSACEMQHRCAVLPQVAKQRLALRIGIHQGLIRQRARDGADNTQDIAMRLAVADDGIVVSELVVQSLNPELRELTRPFDDIPLDIAVHKVDWRREIPSAAFGGESFWPANMASNPVGPYLVLHHGLKTIEATQENPLVTIGRDPTSDLVVVDFFVSRNHCLIERQAKYIVLTDTSTNGTSVLPDTGEEFLVKNNFVVLKGKGLLFFGRPFKGERRGAVRFEAY